MYSNQFSRGFNRTIFTSSKDKADRLVFAITATLGLMVVLFLPWGGMA